MTEGLYSFEFKVVLAEKFTNFEFVLQTCIKIVLKNTQKK